MESKLTSPRTLDGLRCQGNVTVFITGDKELQIIFIPDTEKAEDQQRSVLRIKVKVVKTPVYFDDV